MNRRIFFARLAGAVAAAKLAPVVTAAGLPLETALVPPPTVTLPPSPATTVTLPPPLADPCQPLSRAQIFHCEGVLARGDLVTFAATKAACVRLADTSDTIIGVAAHRAACSDVWVIPTCTPAEWRHVLAFRDRMAWCQRRARMKTAFEPTSPRWLRFALRHRPTSCFRAERSWYQEQCTPGPDEQAELLRRLRAKHGR